MQKRLPYEDAYITNTWRKLEARRRKKKRSVFWRLTSFLTVLAVIFVSVYYSLGVFFKVEKVKIQGNSGYTDKQIIEASGLSRGMNLFGCNLNKIEKLIEHRLLYVENIHAKRKLPNIILLEVKRAKPDVALEYQGKYLIISKTGKILEENALTISSNLDIILDVKVESLSLGQKIKNLDVRRKLKSFAELRGAARKSGVFGAKIFDLNDEQNVVFFCGEEQNIKVCFGQMEQVEYKMRFLAAMFNGSIDDRIPAEINLADILSSKRAIWRPIEARTQSKDEKDEEEKGEKNSTQKMGNQKED